MSSRVGSGLALTAAVLLAVASLPLGHVIGARSISSWWSGHPTIEGKERNLAVFHVGMIKSAGCYMDRQDEIRECTDDDIKIARERKQAPTCGCQPVSLTLGFRITKYVAFGFAMLLAVTLLILALAKKREGLAKAALVFSAINAVSTIILLVIGPSFRDGDATVPMAMVGGMGLHFVGMAFSIVASLVSLMPAKRAVIAAAPAWTAPIPTAPSGPRVAPMAPPQPPPVDVLALLHDDGLRPSALGPEPVLGSRPAQAVASPGGALAGPSGPLGAMTQGPGGQPLFQSAPQLRPLYETDGSNGLPPIKQPELPTRGPTPISMSAVNELMGQAPPPPPAPKPATLPPPLRNKPPSLAPPMPPIPRPTGTTAPPPIGNRTMMGNAVLPPIGVPAVIPPIPNPPPISKSTLAGPPGMILPRPETEDDEKIETVDFEKQDAFDAAATAARDPDPVPESSIVPIDASMLVAGDSTSPSVPFETATNESPAFTEDLETVAREKIEPRPSAPVLTSAPRQTPPATKTPTGASPLIKVPMPAPGAKAKLATPAPIPTPPPSQSQQIKVPISTAPESLPPPKEAKPTTIGPSPACPQCEAPMAWVEEHLRFYCKSCRMYF